MNIHVPSHVKVKTQVAVFQFLWVELFELLVDVDCEVVFPVPYSVLWNDDENKRERKGHDEIMDGDGDFSTLKIVQNTSPEKFS